MSGGDWKEMLTAVHAGNIELVRYHIESGVDPNYQHPELLTTPLIDSIEYEQYNIAKYLLEVGADPELKAGFSADSPLRVARRTKKKRFVELVVSYLPTKPNPLLHWVEILFYK